jgi:hypothetical protein
MKRIRFNIANLLVTILVLGVGFAALRESSDLWDNGVFTLTNGVLLISILLAVHRTEPRRAFWIGFALFGWVYLGLAFVPSIESRLITTKALAYLDSKVPGRSTVLYHVINTGTGSRTVTPQVTWAVGGIRTATAGQGQVRVWVVATGKLLSGRSGTTENFIWIGHSLFALLAAWLGGQLSRRLYQSSRPQEPTATVEAEGIAL